MKRLIILGAGTAGTIMANLMRRRLSRAEWAITVIDRDNEHYYQPGFLFVPFGFYKLKNIVKPRAKFLPRGVEFIIAEVDRIDPAANKIVFQDGSDLPYDYLIVATGAYIVPAETPGMLDGWRDTIFDFYTPDGATALAEKLAAFPGGRIVIHVNETPIKCPVAPLEFAFFCDDCLRRHHRRDKIELVFVTPLPGAFTKPVASKALGPDARREAHPDGDRLQRRAHRRRRPQDHRLRRARGPLRPARHRPDQHGLGDDRALGDGQRVPLPPDRPAHAALEEIRERLRHRRRHGPAVVQGRFGRPFPGRDPGREPRAGDRGPSRSSPRSTGTRTASSRPASARPSSSISTTRSSRCPAASRSRSSARCRSSSRAASTTGARPPSAGSTGTSCCRDGPSRSCRPG